MLGVSDIIVTNSHNNLRSNSVSNLLIKNRLNIGKTLAQRSTGTQYTHHLLSLLTCGAGQRALGVLQEEEQSVLGEILSRLGGAHDWAAGGRCQGQSLMRGRECRVCRGQSS